MDNATTGQELKAARKSVGVTGWTLGLEMGYSGQSPHSYVFQLEARERVTPRMATRYLEALARIGERRGGS